MRSMGYDRSDLNPCIYRDPDRNLTAEEHGDDFMIAGKTQELAKVKSEFGKRFMVKTAVLIAPGDSYDKEGYFLKRKISVDWYGWHLELDGRYVQGVLEKTGMAQCKAMATPGSKEVEGYDKRILDEAEHRDYRSVAGLCQYMVEMRHGFCHERGDAGSIQPKHE